MRFYNWYFVCKIAIVLSGVLSCTCLCDIFARAGEVLMFIMFHTSKCLLDTKQHPLCI